MGTAEIYRAVLSLDEVVDALVVDVAREVLDEVDGDRHPGEVDQEEHPPPTLLPSTPCRLIAVGVPGVLRGDVRHLEPRPATRDVDYRVRVGGEPELGFAVEVDVDSVDPGRLVEQDAIGPVERDLDPSLRAQPPGAAPFRPGVQVASVLGEEPPRNGRERRRRGRFGPRLGCRLAQVHREPG